MTARYVTLASGEVVPAEVVTFSGSDPTLPAEVVGSVAHDGVDTGKPVKVGVYAAASPPTAVSAADRANLWGTLTGAQVVAFGAAATPSDGSSNTQCTAYTYDAANRPLQVYPYHYNGSTWDRPRGDTNALSVLPGLSSTFWSYASGASPILSNTTTAVTIKSSAGGSIRNYVTGIQLTTTAFTAAVPLAIRDGAGGTVLWAVVVPTTGFLQPINIVFPVPLKGTAATLLEIVTTTANTAGTVTANVQGFTGA